MMKQGWVNAVIFSKLFDKQRKGILQSTLILLEGKLQIEGEVIHVIVKRCFNITRMLGQLAAAQQLPLAFAAPSVEATKTIQEKEQKIFPDARNFK